MPKKIKLNRLKVILVERDMMHKDFAKLIGKTPNTVTRICNNEQQPSLMLLRKMATVLDIDIRELIVPTKH